MRGFVLLIWVWCQLPAAVAQVPCPPLPDASRWRSAADYAPARDSVIRVLRWLCHTPLGYLPEERSEANLCVMTWLAGAPEVRVEVDTRAFPFLEEDPDLLFPLIHGMALFQLTHQRSCSPEKLHAEGLAVLAELAERSERLREADYLRAVRKAYRRGGLEDYVRENLAPEHMNNTSRGRL